MNFNNVSHFKRRLFATSVVLTLMVCPYGYSTMTEVVKPAEGEQSILVVLAEGEKSEESQSESNKQQAALKEEKKNAVAKERRKKSVAESLAEKELRRLAAELSLHDEKLKAQFIDLRSEYQRLKWENDLITERMTQGRLERTAKNIQVLQEHEEKIAELTRQKELLTGQLELVKIEKVSSQFQVIAEYEEKLGQLSREKALLSESLDRDKLERELALRDEQIKHEDSMLAVRRESDVLKEKIVLLMAKLEAQDVDSKLKIVKLENELTMMDVESRREQYADKKPLYFEEPLREDGTLVISDRRIALNGPITRGTADYVAERINFYNNKNSKYPIFMVIDASPGGSVLEGFRIIKSMQGSEAPVYVVVKSLAASMAATITAVADRSFTYPNAYFVHHQISTVFFGKMNLTQKKEFYDSSQKLWKRVATPIADKMGITTEEFIKKMYEHSTSGDWVEFGTEAKKLHWVDHVVDSIRETAQLKNPDMKATPEKELIEAKWSSKEVQLDEEGKPFTFLPRLFSHDHYYLYNPDTYYRVR